MRTSSDFNVLQDSAKRWRGLSVLAGAVGLLSLTAVIGGDLLVLNGAVTTGDLEPDPVLLASVMVPLALPPLFCLSIGSAASAQAKATNVLISELRERQSGGSSSRF